MSGMDKGVQPIDRIMEEHGLKNAQLTEISDEHLTCKQIQKARKGRALTRNLQLKIVRALNALLKEKDPPFNVTDLFNYRGR